MRRIKAEGFSDPAMLDWTFENDNGRSPQMHHAHHYVEQWQTMRSENLGLLLWGGVGTGKSFLAGCIANALMEQEVPVRMTNFARILNELNGSLSGRNDVVDKLRRYPLLVIDDFGMERSTEYALEQIYDIVDSRYRSRKPLIVTTNLTLDEIQHPQDPHFLHFQSVKKEKHRCVLLSAVLVSYFYVFNNSRSMRKPLQKTSYSFLKFLVSHIAFFLPKFSLYTFCENCWQFSNRCQPARCAECFFSYTQPRCTSG